MIENTKENSTNNKLTVQVGREIRISDLLKYHFGSRYSENDFKTFKPRENQVKAFDWFNNNDFLNYNIFFYSRKNLTGKSTFLSMIVREIYRKYGEGKLKVWSDSELQHECYQSSFNNEWNYLQKEHRNKKFFVFKDFAKCATTKDFFMPSMFEFIDWIYSNSPPIHVFIASNYSPGEIAKFESKNWLDIATRISDMCQIIEL